MDPLATVGRGVPINSARRQFLLGAIVFVEVTPASHAEQRSAKVNRIGFLGAAYEAGYARELDWIRAGRPIAATQKDATSPSSTAGRRATPHAFARLRPSSWRSR